jgi:Flp pilus assembly protein TadD
MNKALPCCLLLIALAGCGKSEAPAVSQPAASTHVAAPADCDATAVLAVKLRGEFEPKITAADRQRAQGVLQSTLTKKQTEADGYNAFAAGAFVQGQFEPAVWGSLMATTLNWNSRHLTNVGVALMSLKRLDEAESFVSCAALKNPRSPLVVEAQGMLAHRWNDCANATKLLDQAVQKLPRDMNVRYSAAVVHHKCGNAAQAKSLMHEAFDMAPTDATVEEALKVIDPAGASSKASKVPDAVRKQIAECVRFMDEMVLLADAEAKLNQQISTGNDLVSGDYAKELREAVAGHKAALVQQVEAVAKTGQGPGAWNEVLRSAIGFYEDTLEKYFEVANNNGMAVTKIFAASLRMSPIVLEARAQPDHSYLILDELRTYTEVRTPERETLSKCDRDCGSGGELKLCSQQCFTMYCSKIMPSYNLFSERTQANEAFAVGGFPRAAAEFARYWSAYADEAADYTRRTVAVMKFSKGEFVNGFDGPTTVKLVKAGFRNAVGFGVIGKAKLALQSTKERMATEWGDAKYAIQRELETQCLVAETLKEPALSGEVDRLIAALKESGEFESKFENPECEIEIGALKLSCKPLGFESVKATIDVGGMKLRADLDRWGVIASDGAVGDDSGIGVNDGPLTADARGIKVLLNRREFEGNARGVNVKVAATAWVERDAKGNLNAFVQAQSKVGVGVGEEGLGKAGCDFYSASAKFNLREFGEALRK